MKIILKEEQLQPLKLPPFIYKAIMSKNTSIGDNPALPPSGEFGFEYGLIKSKFKEVDEVISKYIERGELESKDPDYLVSVLNKKIEQCKKLEKPIAPQLQKLCENIVNDYFSIPEDTILFKCTLTNKVKPKNSVRILPENDEAGNTYDFEDVDELELTNKVILKRRFINTLIQGFSYWLSTDLDDWYDTVVSLNDELWGLWYNIIHISDYLLFVKKEEISEKNPNQIAYVEVHLGKRGKKTSIESQGIVFPFLLRESIRGFFELFSAHGLPKDNAKAMYIIRKSDFLVAEPWDLRIGMGLIELLQSSLTKKYQTELISRTNKIPFFFSELCSMKVDEFNDVVKNFILGTKKGNEMAKEMDSNISHDFDYQTFKDRIQQKNIDTSLISDGDFSKEELGDYVIQENETDEMMAYHGSGADFDKFNHKKYLNTGAGSQSFGWGTYVTNDRAVANGYSSISGDNIEQIKPFAEKAMEIYGGNEYFSIDDVCTDINSTIKVYHGDLNSMINFYEKKVKEPDKFGHSIDVFNKILLYVAKNMPKIDSYLYEVEIPDDNGENYFEWYEPFPSEFMKRVLYGFLRIHQNYIDSIAQNDYSFRCSLYKDIQWMRANPNGVEKMINILSDPSDEYDEFFASGFYTNKPDMEGRYVYNRLRKLFNSDKAASLFLMQCGFDGIKYPSGTRWQKPDGASDDAYNYVIFDANKVKIVNKTRM